MRTALTALTGLAAAAALLAALAGAPAARAGSGATVYLPLIRTAGEAAPGGDLPAELVGTWFSGQLLNLNYYNREAGVWDSAGGLGHMLVLGADGRYTRVSHLELGGGTTCVSSVDVYQVGAARAEGGQLWLTPSYARTRTVTCGSTTSDTEGPYAAAALPWLIGEGPERHTRLRLDEPHGETLYYKDGVGAQVVGSWASGDGGAAGLYDPASDRWAAPTGASSVWFELGADGRYRAGRVDAGIGGDPCRPVTMTYEAGALGGSGAQITLRPQTVRRHVVSLCDPSDASDTAPPAGGETRWTWLFAADGETLSMIRVSAGFEQHLLSPAW